MSMGLLSLRHRHNGSTSFGVILGQEPWRRKRTTKKRRSYRHLENFLRPLAFHKPFENALILFRELTTSPKSRDYWIELLLKLFVRNMRRVIMRRGALPRQLLS